MSAPMDLQLKAATDARDELLKRATRGEAITVADVREAEELARNAETELALAQAAEVHRRSEREKAEIAAFQIQAAEREADVVSAAKGFTASAKALDEAMRAARAAADTMDRARTAFSAADHAAHRHNGAVAAAANENRTLRAMHPSTWPKARTPAASPQRFEAKIEIALATLGGAPQVLHQTAVQMAESATHTVPGL